MLVAAIALIVLPPIWSLFKNYREAKKVGLPIFITPIPGTNPLTWIIGPFVFPFMLRLPSPISDWARYGEAFWQFPDRANTITKYGPAFIMVSPGPTQLFLADPGAGEELLSRTKNFIKPPEIYSNVEIYGPNVDTVNGEAWNRHRKLTTPPFNERNSSLVWQESLSQVKGMLDAWIECGAQGVRTTSNDTMKLALHVLTGAGFGQTYDYKVGLTKLPEGHTMSYRDALAAVLSDIMTAVLVTKLPISLSFLPAFKRMEHAMDEFRRYMAEMVDQERNASRPSSRDNLMSALVRAADTSKSGGSARESLTDEELYGNLFIWNLAGHDTTANTLAFAVTLLSVHPEVQEWISEEINSVFGSTPPESWDYEAAFPRLKRVLALMYETLRVYGPVPSMPKTTGQADQTLRIAGNTYNLPPQWFVVLNLVALHCDPATWGPNALTWEPRRFIEKAQQTGSDGSGEQMMIPRAGSFGPWAGGPRVCPGKKFAQVEFVAVISYLFRNTRVRPVLLEGETQEQAKRRVMAVVDDSGLEASPTVKMRHPERVRLVWSSS